jgi:hypothetical protein
MRRTKKSACRGGGRRGGAVDGGRCAECSTLQSQFHRIEAWTAWLRGREVGVLLALVRHQPSDGSAFALRHSQIAGCIGVKRDHSVKAVKRLRALGLVEVAVQGDAQRANEYRVPNPLPPAPPVPTAARALQAKGGER